MKFQNKVIQIVNNIPRGKIATYKKVAILAERPRAYRAVGNILNRNFRINGSKIPCHRVIRSDGKIGGYALDKKSAKGRSASGGKKEKLLKREGIRIKKHSIDLKQFNWNPKSP